MKKKIIVAHFGKQHSYKLAEAVKKIGYLNKYITTVYLKKNNWTYLVSRILKGKNLKRVKSRNCLFLFDFEVKQFCEFSGLINLLLMRIDKTKKIYNQWASFTVKRFGKKVANYAIKNKVETVIMYDTNASECFRILEKKAPNIIRILDMSTPTHEYMKKIYMEDMKRCPKFSKNLRFASNFFWNKKILAKCKKEINLTDYFLVPSKFVKESLEYHNISSEKIKICPYGVDIKETLLREKKNKKEKLKVIYIGQLTQRKGISYLLEALEIYDKKEITLTLIGEIQNIQGEFDEYIKKYQFKGFINHDEVINELKDADVMVFPSLSDGFGLAALEALGAGIPVICTENSGCSDIIQDGYNGFVIPVGNINAIREKINWFLINKDKINQMSKNSRETAKRYTWNEYEKCMKNIILNILEEGK